VPDDIVRKLLKGKYVHIHKLLRQPQHSYTPTKEEHTLAPGVVISTKRQHKKRQVDSQFDYIEALFSSLLPAQAQVVLNTLTPNTPAHAAATQLQRTLTFSLSAVDLFRRHTFTSALKYLESHREACARDPSQNIAVRDLHRLHNLMAPSSNSSSSSSSASYHTPQHSGGSGSAAASSGGSGSGSRGRHPPDGTCGAFNSRAGCTKSPCTYKHTCRSCSSSAHGRAQCPSFQPKLGKNSVPVPAGTSK
jgi:hypothetical protein